VALTGQDIAALTPGASLDGFRIEERLHEGGMATVWRVSRPGVAYPLVMKVPRLGNRDDPAAIVGFETETNILPRLFGPHVPRFVSSGDFDEQPYLAMEYLPGPTLEERRAAAPLAAAEVAGIGARIADALQALHDQQVAHLDLSPDNVVFRAGGEAVLLDFGLAFHQQLPDLLAEEFDRPLGTAAYMAPEQVLGVRDEPRSDLFALGAILYALTTGQLPFGEPETPRGLRLRLTREAVPPRSLARECPPWLQEVILKCLEVDPALRHESAARLAADLRNPERIVLTKLSERLRGRGPIEQVNRRLRGSLAALAPGGGTTRRPRAQEVPVILAAVDVTQASSALVEALRIAVRRACDADPAARLTCVTVHRVAPGTGLNTAEGGRAVHVQRLVALKRWARQLGVAQERVSFHVLGAADPAAAILKYANANRVDQIVIGARGSSALRRHVGSVSARVAAEAPCTVVVVRAGR
jgi:nucleotide-binding universal stress UspA family protein